MNRNFTAICAALLMCAFMMLLYVTPKISKNPVAAAESAPEKVIYLTFDDGPSNRVTPKILDVLKEENVKATFFIIGKNAEIRQDIIKREVDEGHTVGIHSYTHVYNKIYNSPEKLLEDIDRCNKVIKDITGKKSSIYRFPGGSYGLSDKLLKTVEGHGLKYVDWNASMRDAEFINPAPQQLINAAKNTPTNTKKIVLLAHDTTDKSATVCALKPIIKYYKSLNYSFAAF